ncbi:hypothetical protein CF161_18409 [Pseudomonas sp. CF161]|nr:hypothetical protein CF161_18409 [Pseudomonas sp. CF161]
MIFNLTHPLFQYSQRFLLNFVTLLQLQKLLFQGLYVRIGRCLQQRCRK